MSESNMFSWASSQPIWIQVFIGLFLFFVVLPVVIFVVSEMFSGIGTSLDNLAKTFSRKSIPQVPQAATEPDKFSDEVLLQALCHIYSGRKTSSQIMDYLSDKTAAERSALKKNPQVLRAIAEMSNENENQGSAQPRP